MKYTVSEQELPARMRRFLADIDNGKAYSAATLQRSRAGMSSCLRCLVETARLQGLPDELNEDTAAAMVARLTDSSWRQTSIATQRSLLRQYAYETGEGIEWALLTTGSDRRPIPLVLKAPHWAPYRALIPFMLQQGIVDRIIRLADRWLHHRRKTGKVTEQHVRDFKTDPRDLGRLAEFMTAIAPGHPDTRLLQAVQRKQRSKAKGHRKFAAYGTLPEPFLSQMRELAAKSQRHDGLSEARIKVMGCAIRRLLRSAKARDLAPLLTMDTARAFAEDLVASDLKAISAAGYCDFLGYFARHAGYPAEISDALLETHWALKAEAKGQLRHKEIRLAETPISLVDLAGTAHDVLVNAPEVDDIRNRRRDYTLAGAIALLCKLPIRAKDIRDGKIGDQFCRDSEGWCVDLKTSKTGQEIKGRLADCLTPYLDAVLLVDTDPAHLWQVYDARIGTALFANPARDWQNYEREWLRRNMIERTGHSPHIVRSLVYDACVLDQDLDIRVAQALCGHGNETSRKFYELNADRFRRQSGLHDLARIEKAMTG